METASLAARPLNNPDFAPTGGEVSTSLAERAPDGSDFWGEDGFTFADFLDIINPLQHLPIIGSIYRAITGDEISPAARIAGGALFGGPFGVLGAAANQAIEEATGTNIGTHAVALFDDETAVDAEALLAEANAAPSAPVSGVAPAVAPPLVNASRPAAHSVPPVMAGHALARPATPPAMAGAVPSLSPQAFGLLMREFGGPAGAIPAAQSRPDELPRPRGTSGEERRRAALELHQLLADRHATRARAVRHTERPAP